MGSHPDLDVTIGRPGLVLERSLGGTAGLDRSTRIFEGEEEAVALCVHLVPPVPPERRADESVEGYLERLREATRVVLEHQIRAD